MRSSRFKCNQFRIFVDVFCVWCKYGENRKPIVNLVTPAFYTVFTLTSLTIAKEYQMVYTLQSLLASEVSLVCAKIDILSD
jgi:hypothetical protein